MAIKTWLEFIFAQGTVTLLRHRLAGGADGAVDLIAPIVNGRRSDKPLPERRQRETPILVEDHLSSRANIAEFLRSRGGPDGLEALNLLSRRMIDLMVLDVVIPQIHGLNLLKLFCSNTPALPVIVISAYLSEPAGKIILEGSAEFSANPWIYNSSRK